MADRLRQSIQQNSFGSGNQGLQLAENNGNLTIINVEKTHDSEDYRSLQCFQGHARNYSDGKDFNPRRVPGTCDWFLSDDRFTYWRDSNTPRLLWVSADPGYGKSVLARTLIDEKHLSTNDVAQVETCYFFFKEGYESRMHATNALCAMLHQLLESPSCTETQLQHAKMAYNRHGGMIVHEFGKLWDLFLDCVKVAKSEKVICVLDALDECDKEGRSRLIEKLKDLYCRCEDSNAKSRLKFLITSRAYDDLELDFEELSLLDSDMTTYLRFDGDEKYPELEKETDMVIDYEMRKMRFVEPICGRITKRLKSERNRTYLWLHLIFCMIKEERAKYENEDEVDQLLSNLPRNLPDAYGQILNRSRYPKYTRALLQIVLVAKRSLSLDEVNAALTLAVNPQEESSSYDCCEALKGKIWSRDSFATTVKNLGGLFIGVYDLTYVSFIHQTARDFLVEHVQQGKLEWRGQLEINESHAFMARICLKHLSYFDFEREPNRNQYYQERFPLLEYSVENWEGHARPIEEYVFEDIWDFVCRKKAFLNWHELRFWQFAPGEFVPITPILAKFGLIHTMHKFIKSDEGFSILKKYHEERTSLLRIACRYGYKEVVQWLWGELKADKKEENIASGEPLEDACLQGHKEIVQLLLRNGFDANGGHLRRGRPLVAACRRHFEEVACLLLENGADINKYTPTWGTPLAVSCGMGYEKIVKILVEKGADINLYSHGHGTPLMVACEWGHKEIVELLLDEGAEINKYFPGRGTPLVAACQYGHQEIVQLLFQKGANINKDDPKYGRLLMVACQRGYRIIEQLFQERGVDYNQQCIRIDMPFKPTSLSNRRNLKKRLPGNVSDSTTIVTQKEAKEVGTDSSNKKWTPCSFDNTNEKNNYPGSFQSEEGKFRECA